MSPFGPTRTFRDVRIPVAFRRKADELARRCHLFFGRSRDSPEAEQSSAARRSVPTAQDGKDAKSDQYSYMAGFDVNDCTEIVRI
jgi:hypothetical protein